MMKMTIVKELNELAEKMTGINPRATTDAQAMDFIEQHYQGGQPSPTPTPTPTSKFDYIIPEISFDPYDDVVAISDSEIISILDEIQANSLDKNNNIVDLRIGAYFYDTDGGNKSFSSMVACNEIGSKGVNKYIFIMFTFGSSPKLLAFNYSNNNWSLSITTLNTG